MNSRLVTLSMLVATHRRQSQTYTVPLKYFYVSHTHASVTFGTKKDGINKSHRFIKVPILDTNLSTLCSIAAEVKNML